MEDYNRVLDATTVSENANGTAAEKMTIYTQTLEAAQNNLTSSIQQFAQDSNLDQILIAAYNGLAKVVEILNILLNKIPVLSPLIKAMGTALATAFAGATIKNIISTSEMLKGIVSAAPGVVSAFANMATGAGTFGAVVEAAGGPLTIILGLLSAFIAIAPSVASWWQKMFPSTEKKAEDAKNALEESNSALEETNSKIKEIQDQISEIDSKDTLTLTDQAEKERLEEELETLKQIKETQEDIAKSKKAETLQATRDVISEKYASPEMSVEDYLGDMQKGYRSASVYDTETASIEELTASVEYLRDAKKNLSETDSQYQEKLNQINQTESESRQALLSKKQELLDYKQQLIELGDTSSEEYQLVNDKINDITIALDPSKFPKIDLGEMIETSGMENKIKMVVQSGSEAGKKVAEGYAEGFAEQLTRDESMANTLQQWADSMGVSVEYLKNNTGVLTQEILAQFQQMYGGISEASESAAQGFTDQHTALDAYNEAVQNIHDSTTDLTAAYQDMISKGYISESVVKKLTAAHPELVKELKLENGQYKISLQTLKDVYTAEVNKSIASIESEKKQTQATIESIKTRILAYQKEAEILAQNSDDPSAKAKMIGIQHSIDRANWQIQELQADADDVDKYIAQLKQNATDWSPTKSSSSKSSAKSAADKAAKEFEDSIKDKVKNLKSIVDLYSEQQNWEDPSVVQKFTTDYNNLLTEVINNPKARKVLADAFNLDISKMSDEDQIKNLTTLWQKQAGTIQETYQKLLKSLAKEDLTSAKAVIEKYKEGIYGAWSSDEALNAAKADYQKFIDKITNDADYRAAMAEALNLGDISGESVEKQVEAVIKALLKSTGTLDDAQQDLYDDASKNIKALQDEIEDMIDTAIDLLQKAGDFLFDMLGKISDRYDAQIDNLDKISDELDDQKDAFEDKIDKQKELLKLQKEEMDNADELAEKNKSIADIDAQLIELKYDNSAEAQAKRLKLLDERAEKEKDLADWQKDNDYNVKINALDKEKSEYEKTIEAEKKAIEAQKQALQDAQKQFETTLGKIQNGFNTFIKILSSDLVKNLISKALIGTGQDTVTQLLTGYNKLFGTGIDSDVTGIIKEGYKSLADIGSDVLNNVSNSSKGIVRSAAKGVTSIVNNTTSGIKSIFNSSNGFMKRLTSNGISSLNTIGTSGKGIISSLAGTANGLLSNLNRFASGIGRIATKGISGIFSGIGGATSGVTSGIGGIGLAGAGLSGALPIAAIGAGVLSGALANVSTWYNNIKLWKDKDKSTGKKILGTIGNLILPFLPGGMLISAGKALSSLFKKHHTGADYVKKQNPMLDKMLGLGSDETISILKVGEAVVPTWANGANSSGSNNKFTGSPFGSAVDSAVKSARAISGASYTTNNAPVTNISMPINIQGDADSATIAALKKEADNIVNKVMKTINNQTRIGGYRNVKAATI